LFATNNEQSQIGYSPRHSNLKTVGLGPIILGSHKEMQESNSDIKMASVLWHEKYNTGITLIDNQHKELVIIINKLIFSVNDDITNEVILIIFNELYDYTNYHLKFEEQYFDKNNEIDVHLHKLQHKHFIEHLDEIKHSLKENNLSNELIYFVADWLLVHIQHEDKKLINYLEIT
jgi:hemerythrin